MLSLRGCPARSVGHVQRIRLKRVQLELELILQVLFRTTHSFEGALLEMVFEQGIKRTDSGVNDVVKPENATMDVVVSTRERNHFVTIL